jgi:hypothetical protein
MTPAEKQRRYRERKLGPSKGRKPTAAQLQSHIRELEAERAAKLAALERFGLLLDEVCDRLRVPDQERRLDRELENRARRTPNWITGYQNACDWIFGGRAEPKRSAAAKRSVGRSKRTKH